MAPISWPVDPVVAANSVGHEPGHYLLWAVWSVDGLHYLDDLDQQPERARWIVAGHHEDTIDLSHARWAAGTAMTALDLSAATLGALHNLPTPKSDQVHDVGDLDKQSHRAQLCAGCLNWLDVVLNDPDYAILKSARDPLTHRSIPRHVYGTTVGSGILPGTHRLGLYVAGASGSTRKMSSRQLVEHARDTATRHVQALLRAAQAGAL
jgi:hypothetical protein